MSNSKPDVGRDDLLAENPIYNMLKNSPIFNQLAPSLGGMISPNDIKAELNGASRGALLNLKGRPGNIRFGSDEDSMFQDDNSSLV